MNTAETEILTAAQAVAPDAPVVEAATAVASTIANPTPSAIVADLELAYQLASDLKSKLAGMHPTISNLVKLLF